MIQYLHYSLRATFSIFWYVLQQCVIKKMCHNNLMMFHWYLVLYFATGPCNPRACFWYFWIASLGRSKVLPPFVNYFCISGNSMIYYHSNYFLFHLLMFRYFNSLQSECFSGCFLSSINMVISAPTGSGKTVLFELCILRLLSRFLSEDGKFNHMKGTLKTVSFVLLMLMTSFSFLIFSLGMTGNVMFGTFCYSLFHSKFLLSAACNIVDTGQDCGCLL